MLVAYCDFTHQLPQLLGFGLYGTKTMFLTVLFLLLLLFVMTLVDLFISTGTMSLQFECTLPTSLSISLSFSLTSTLHCSVRLFMIVCVEVVLLPLEKRVSLAKYISNSSFQKMKWPQFIISPPIL